ncbi:MAG: threonine synthase [Gammaproteobacteria bacterium]
MRLYNINDCNETASFIQAALRGMGSKGGLYFPEKFPYFKDINTLLGQDFINRSISIAKAFLEDELPNETIIRLVKNTFQFPVILRPITSKISALELFHGPTLAFKDFGARFMAELFSELRHINKDDKPTTILCATSGDTGAAVANAFYGLSHIQVVILYPYQRISALQEKMFCTLGGNIHTLAVKGDFDVCQAMVKQCFAHPELVDSLGLNVANSINISRLLPQSFYYFEAMAQLPQNDNTVIAVPSGNFGNLTAGLWAQRMGLPIKSFIAATNSNDTIPRYLRTGKWQVNPTVNTLSNAIDVSFPNNWPRIEELFNKKGEMPQQNIRSIAINEDDTIDAMRELHGLGYIADPHSAVAYAGLKECLQADERGVFICTAHPAKFKQSVEQILQIEIPLSSALANVVEKPILSKIVEADFAAIRSFLCELG